MVVEISKSILGTKPCQAMRFQNRVSLLNAENYMPMRRFQNQVSSSSERLENQLGRFLSLNSEFNKPSVRYVGTLDWKALGLGHGILTNGTDEENVTNKIDNILR
jgi:hypothetical protein